ncbi:hypothetical protein [Paraliomyxa miuraensis]|uniref:hypothetical protein n=1 Tax=Paraliomyxa miuraensis TaxID=376150 RepID=UPI0022564A66|nr:hypothetical protein [Paraliomyxa miuraensis]MCX4244969.1 hypothetical protein [Paraliomyxa miuraensis]
MQKPIIIAAFALGLLACKQHDTTKSPAEGEHSSAAVADGQSVDAYGDESYEEPATPKEVMKDPDYGERVTLEGEVDVVYDPRTFSMKAGIFQDDLLVVAPAELVAEALVAPDKVRVTGTVKKMVVSEAEREYSIDFDNAVEVKWEDRPYLVAESIEKLPD